MKAKFQRIKRRLAVIFPVDEYDEIGYDWTRRKICVLTVIDNDGVPYWQHYHGYTDTATFITEAEFNEDERACVAQLLLLYSE
jgi:hypothetical protein